MIFPTSSNPASTALIQKIHPFDKRILDEHNVKTECSSLRIFEESREKELERDFFPTPDIPFIKYEDFNPFIIIVNNDTLNQSKQQFWKLCVGSAEGSITSKPFESLYIEDEINSIFNNARDEIFEDGIESNFSHLLINFILKYNEVSIDVISTIILNNQSNSWIISEALRWIGKLNHPQTHHVRLNLLERCLFSESYYIRDGAILGIEFLNDKSAIDTIKLAIEKEDIPELKEYMSQVIYFLEKD